MCVVDWLAVAGYFVLAILLGWCAARVCRLPPSRLVHDWSACYLSGQLVLTLLTLSTGFVPWTHAQLLAPVAVIAAGAGVARIVVERSGRRAALAALAAAGSVLLAVALFPNLAVLVQRAPALESDARSIWLFHGKALFVAGGIAPDFFTDPLYWWSSPDYPLLLPAQAAWSSLLVGRWSEVACRAFLLFHFAAWFRLLHLVLLAKGYPWWLALFVTGAFLLQGTFCYTNGFAYVSGQADYHCAVPLALAMLVLSVPRSGATGPGAPASDHAPLVVLLLAYAASVKNEGTVHAALFAAAWLAWIAVRIARRQGWRAVATAVAARPALMVHAGVLGLLPLLLWAIFKAVHGIGSNLHLLERAATPALFAELLSARAATVLQFLWDNDQMQQTCRLLIALAALAGLGAAPGLLGRKMAGMRRGEALAALALLVVVGLIFLTYVLTPHDFVYHMQTSLGRLLFLPHLIVFVLCVFRLDPLVQWIAPAGRLLPD